MQNTLNKSRNYLWLVCVLILLLSGCSGSSSSDNETSDYNAITAFSFLADDNIELSSDVDGLISGGSKTINLAVPTGTDVNAMVPTIDIAGSSISPASGVPTDFTNPVTYTITAEDGTTSDFTVTVTIAPVYAREITAFSLKADDNTDLSYDVIAAVDGTVIIAIVPYGTDMTDLTASFSTSGETVTVNGTMQVSGETINDFSNPLLYKVSAADSSTRDYTVGVVDRYSYYSVSSVFFIMKYVPGGLTFPTGIDDLGTPATVTDSYLIGQTEVTYELWYTVRDWAENIASPAYTFSTANIGREGISGIDGNPPTIASQEPVTSINWRDAMVWMNAMTEYYNMQNGTSLTCVYYTDENYSTPIRIATDSTTLSSSTPGSQDNPYIKSVSIGNTDMANNTGTGFRLLTTNEWELAARYIIDDGDNILDQSGEFYPGGYASGSDAYYIDSVVNDFDGNGYLQTLYDVSVCEPAAAAAVKSKSPNALGLYDMSGNVWELTFDWDPSNIGSKRILRGGSWDNEAAIMRLGIVVSGDTFLANTRIGFRFARTP